MAINLFDGTAYIIKEEQEIERSAGLCFFLDGRIGDALILHDADGEYNGMITYRSLLKSNSIKESIIYEKLILDVNDVNEFWKKARKLMANGNNDMLPIFNPNMELLYFAKYDSDLEKIYRELVQLRENVNRSLWRQFKNHKKHIHFIGMNDILYFFYQWLRSIGAEVSVEGEVWRIMGLEESLPEGKECLIANESCELVHSLYLEYWDILEDSMSDELAELRDVMREPYIYRKEQRKIMFHLTQYSYFADSILPLLNYYLEHGKECVAVFSPIQEIISMGKKNAQKLIKIIRQIQELGGKCYLYEEEELWMQEYEICYLCSEYSDYFLPVKAKNVVAVQTTAIYTHMYMFEGKFEAVFSEQARGIIDYMVVSEFIAKWICEKNQNWQDKLLRFGYPKLDALYCSLKNKDEIPEEWKKKVAGKKVFFDYAK